MKHVSYTLHENKTHMSFRNYVINVSSPFTKGRCVVFLALVEYQSNMDQSGGYTLNVEYEYIYSTHMVLDSLDSSSVLS